MLRRVVNNPFLHIPSERVRRTIQVHRIPILVFISISLIGFALIPLYRFQINPDGVSYISIAQKYASGDFRHAINGYWGPLLSILLVPSVWLSIDSIVAIKALQVLIAVGLMITSYSMLLIHSKQKYFSLFGATVVGITGLEWALAEPLTPDLLVCFLGLLLVHILTYASQKKLSNRWLISIGVIGALLYFSKSAGFFLFCGMWGAWVISDFIWGRKDKRALQASLRPKIISLIVFISLITPFVLAISIKYSHPTLGTSGNYNLALVGPHSEGHPMTNRGLLPPPNPTAPSIWEDISRVPVKTWSPFDSKENFDQLKKNLRTNYQTLWLILSGFGIFLIGSVLYVLYPERQVSKKKLKFLLSSLAIISIALYLPIFIEVRYIFAALTVLIIGALLFISAQYDKGYKALPIVGILLATIFCYQVPIKNLVNSVYVAKPVFEESRSLKTVIKPSSHVASDTFDSIFACYYTKSACYGVINPDDPNAKRQLQQFSIDHLIISPETAYKLQAAGIHIKKVEDLEYSGNNIYSVYGF